MAESREQLDGDGVTLFVLDGDDVGRGEFLDAVVAERYATQVYFRRVHGASMGSDFWSSSFGGESVSGHLVRCAVGRLRHRRAFYRVMTEAGLVDDAGYAGCRRRWRRSNERLDRAVRSGETVYGLSRYDFDAYLAHEMADLEERYCADPSLPGMDVGEDEVGRFLLGLLRGGRGRSLRPDEARAHAVAELRKQKFVNIVNKYADGIEVDGVPWRALQALVEQTVGSGA